MERLCRVLILSVFTVIAAAVSEWPLSAGSQGRPLYVSVTDSKGAPAAGITASDLVVEAKGKPAAITRVVAANEPVSVVVITEGFGRETISDIRKMMKAVVAGARAIHPESRVGLMVQDGAGAPKMHAVAAEVQALDAEISRFFESTRNAPLLDSILIASQTLAFEKHPRRAIVAVTWGDGAQSDVRSPVLIANAVRASGASLWVLDLGGRGGEMAAPGLLDPGAELRVLSDVTEDSGGRRESTTVSSIAPLTERILATLRGQYAIHLEDGLAPKAASPKVSARTKGLKVLAPAWPAAK